MKRYLFLVFLTLSCAMAQTENGKVTPKVTTLPIEEGAVTVLRLGAGYVTSVRLPEEISSVVIGHPASFRAEHSEAEPQLVFLKPITAQAVESNALITTKSGQEISLHLISAGQAAGNLTVDFLLEYGRPHSVVISPAGTEGFLIPEAGPVSPPGLGSTPVHTEKLDVVSRELERQKAVSSPAWEGKEILAALGESSQHEHQTLLRFSVLNNSRRVVELLPPQIEFSGTAMRKKGARIKAEPIAISEYRMTSRRSCAGRKSRWCRGFRAPGFQRVRRKTAIAAGGGGPGRPADPSACAVHSNQ